MQRVLRSIKHVLETLLLTVSLCKLLFHKRRDKAGIALIQIQCHIAAWICTN